MIVSNKYWVVASVLPHFQAGSGSLLNFQMQLSAAHFLAGSLGLVVTLVSPSRFG
jgi:hypothetical protein